MDKKFIIETSARHVHVTQEALEILFGKGYALTNRRDLSQPGQFVCGERVEVVGPKKSISNISILGPERSAVQVEISLTDARTLGIAAPVRQSGDIEDTPGCKIVGPAGEITIGKGVIAAKRHIHMTPADAAEFGVSDNQVVSVRAESAERSLVFDDVVVRISEKFSLAMHVDTDESNAAGLSGDAMGQIV